ncbi:50S ribosomal protein L6 [Patescibacteria group bacterium]
MSRVGNQPINIPENVTVNLTDNKVVVIGSKGQLEQIIRSEVKVEINDKEIVVSRKSESKLAKSLHGLTRTLISNMIEGVEKGFEKTLELHGTGYRVSLEGKNLKILVGFSHPVVIEPLENIEFQVEDNKIIKILGIDKQLVGQVTASIRDIRKPEPYKGKGIRYKNEKIRRKAGKAAKTESA